MASKLLSPIEKPNRRILILDDNESIHQDFRKLLSQSQDLELQALESRLFEAELQNPNDDFNVSFHVDSAFQGKEGVDMIKAANDKGNPYSLVFVDIRMPPGWNGVRTIQEIRKIDEKIQVVICTAYSDFSWQELTRILGHTSSLLVLKKPFDAIEVQQIALALTEKWRLSELAGLKMSELEEMVAEQTERLIKTNRQKDEFISAFSHELMTPLNAVTGYARSLSSRDADGLSGTQLLSIREIESNGQVLLGMVNDLLDLARFDAREQELNLSSVSTLRLVESVIRMLSPHWRKKHIDIEIQHDPSVSEIAGDELKLKQILMNLIFNAIKFTSDSGHIIVTTTRIDEGNISISISDNGIGIESDMIDHIFDRYFQGELVKEEYKGGVGIGLSVTKNLVELHGGSIQVESTWGSGSIFNVILPEAALNTRLSEQRTLNPENFQYGTSSQDGLIGTKVLVVDDNSINREILNAILEELGANIAIATNGQEAIDKAMEFLPDVILMDLLMPVLGGIEATRKIKASDVLASIPVIAVTASIDNTTLSEAREAGCFACIHKPVKENEVRELILSATRTRSD